MNQKHGLSRTSTYWSWRSMNDRCSPSSPQRATKHRHYQNVSVCKRWESLENFVADMGLRPDGCTLGRIGDCGDYEPGNCEWQSNQTQFSEPKKGDKNPAAKLTQEQADVCRSLYMRYSKRQNSTCTASHMARDLGISTAQMTRILKYKTYIS